MKSLLIRIYVYHFDFMLPLRIDNCWRSVICAFGHFSDTNFGKETYAISSKRIIFCQSDDISDIKLKR